MMKEIQNIIKYYRACYVQDFKAISVPNFFAKAVEYLYVLKSFEPINGKLRQYPVNSEWGAALEKAMLIHGKEKALYVGAFFLKGKMQVIGRATSVFAPLFLYEANLVLDDDVYYVEVDAANPILNPSFLGFVKANDPSVTCTYDEMDRVMPKGVLNFDNLVLLQRSLGALFPNWNVDAIEDVIRTDAIKVDLAAIQKRRSKLDDRRLLAGAAIGLATKPKGARGVLNELSVLAEKKLSSKILEALFYPSSKAQQKIRKRDVNVPVSLSERQKQVLYSVDSHDFTLVIGPPGTGKSFTIAALVTELIGAQKSVLVASKNSQAGEVIATKLNDDFGLGGLVIETNKKGYKRILRKRVQKILIGLSAKILDDTRQVLAHQVAQIGKRIRMLTSSLLEREKEELKWGQFFYEYKDGFFQRFQSKWVEYKYRKSTPVWELKQRLDEAEREKNQLVKKYIQANYDFQLNASLVSKRNEFTRLVNALSQETGSLIQKGFAVIDFRLILKALPAWICNAADVHSNLPLEEGLFDVVIIDEASQCDIASMLPLMYRAKKVVIVGDPMQLRHISFLSSFQERELKKKFGLNADIPDYRTTSILDLVNAQIASQHQVIFLDEHFRSMPDIISFSNQEFYSGHLKLMTESPTTLIQKSLFLRSVNGHRSPSGKNEIEAQAIIDEVIQLLEDQCDMTSFTAESIGILSPFRAQVTLLKSKIRAQIPLEDIRKHRILIGSPFHFQGEERDVMYLSFVVDDDTHHATYNYLNREDVFNVSVTRARNRQFVYSSIQQLAPNPQYLLTKYLSHIQQEMNLNVAQDDIYDGLAEEVIELLESWGLTKIFKSFSVAGVDIDIVVVHKEKTYCIDLVGYPGLFEAQFTPAKIRRLARMNHDVFFLPYSGWYLEKERLVEGLKRFVGVRN